MTALAEHHTAPLPTGLRDRQKARRRDAIIAAAKDRFIKAGIDATTMADIAAAAEVSTPTVFNYFGSKDGILIAMITEGTQDARESDRGLHWKDGTDLTCLLTMLFLRVSTRTLDIAGKRVWRYAEAAAIRHPDTDLAREYAKVSQELILVISDFFAGLDLTLRSGRPFQPHYIAGLFHDLWMPRFIELITQEDQGLAQHEVNLRQRLGPLVDLLFTDDCIARPRRKDRAT
jgi:AcrR family transcriptional regulator